MDGSDDKVTHADPPLFGAWSRFKDSDPPGQVDFWQPSPDLFKHNLFISL